MDKIKNFFSEYAVLFKSNTKHMIFTIVAAVIVGAILFGGSGNDNSTTKETTSRNSSDNNTVVSESETANNNSSEETYTKYSNGMYKIGSDMPAGEYVIISDSVCYIEVCSDSTGAFDSIIINENFSNRYYITVLDGQYLEFTKGYAVSVADAVPATVNNRALPSGMYKIGLDIPAGEYKVRCTSDTGYFAIYSKSTNTLDDIVTNDIFEAEKYVTVSDGQYILLSGAELIVG